MSVSEFIRLKKKACYLLGYEVLELSLTEQVAMAEFCW